MAALVLACVAWSCDSGDGTASTGCARKVYDGHAAVNRQEDVANYEGYTRITGDLRVFCNRCTDLNGLECLESVEGSVEIGDRYPADPYDDSNLCGGVGNFDLEDLSGLAGLRSVGSLFVKCNTELTKLDWFASLETIEDELGVVDNDSLPSCEICELLDSLVEEPGSAWGYSNLDDSCWPFPENCP